MFDLARIRRLEAVGFRSFPATTMVFSGTWAIRLTAGHPARRLNSVNPLDPHDTLGLKGRIELARQRFRGFGRPLVFRLTPLAPPSLQGILEEQGWSRFDESMVMEADLASVPLAEAIDQVPHQDAGRWIDCYIWLSRKDPSLKPGLAEIFSSTAPEIGFFMHHGPDGRLGSVARCVHDRDLAGIFDVVTDPGFLRQGHGKAVLLSALAWARRRGAKRAWLQVETDNQAAIALYCGLGFSEVYRYSYFRPEDGDSGMSGLED